MSENVQFNLLIFGLIGSYLWEGYILSKRIYEEKYKQNEKHRLIVGVYFIFAPVTLVVICILTIFEIVGLAFIGACRPLHTKD